MKKCLVISNCTQCLHCIEEQDGHWRCLLDACDVDVAHGIPKWCRLPTGRKIREVEPTGAK